MDLDSFLAKFEGVKKSGTGWIAKCPAHDDHEPSLSIRDGEDGCILLKCHAGCPPEAIVSALGLEMKDLFSDKNISSPISQHDTAHLHTTKQPVENYSKNTVQGGVTLCRYAAEKNLPEAFLRELGLKDTKRNGSDAIRIPYCDRNGVEKAVRYRTSLEGENRFSWQTGSKPFLYGLPRLPRSQALGGIFLVEGESDCHTLWHHGLIALGLPGASNWRENRDAIHLDGIPAIYVIREPDKGGEAVEQWMRRSSIRSRVFLVSLGEHKDPSALYLADPENFKANIEKAREAAVPWAEHEKQCRNAELAESWAACKDLARDVAILDRFAELLPRCGLVGEERAAKLIFLCLITRMFERPTSAIVDGPSSVGKSHLVETVLKFFPSETHHDLTAMSERNLAFTDEPLAHRFLVLYEMAGLLGSELATYIIRSLLSEGRIRYEFVDKTAEGLKSRLIEKEGPTGLLMTTTAVYRHPENETRVIAVTVNDTREQTKNVLLALAKQDREAVDFAPWHALQDYLQNSEAGVTIPFAYEIARRTKPEAVRLRRDFAAVLSLTKAHALLHQATRDRDARGRIIATPEDYAVVLGLVGDLIADSVGATVPESVRETINTVQGIIDISTETPPVAYIAEISEALNVDRSAATRRVATAMRRGYLRDIETKKGKPKKIVPGDPLPENTSILPTIEDLQNALADAHVHTTQKGCTPQNVADNQIDTGRVCRCAVGCQGKEGEQNADIETDQCGLFDATAPVRVKEVVI